MEKREIKFRGWDEKRKKMTTEFVLDCGGTAYTILTGLKYEGLWETKLHLMQFTGLLDKNGREIYEGDILKLQNGQIYPVIWQTAGFPLVIFRGFFEAEGKLAAQIEIIGNIYENPELLSPNL